VTTTTVVLALTSTSEGEPACLQVGDGGQGPLVIRLIDQFDRYGRVVVVTWRAWAPTLRSVVAGYLDAEGRDPDDLEVVAVDTRVAALRWLHHGSMAGHGAAIVLVHGHLVADDLAIGRVADDAAGGTGALVGSIADHEGAPVRVTRGRIVAAGSPYHAIRYPGGAALDVLRVGPGDHDGLRAWADELAKLLEAGTPAHWRAEVARRSEGRPDEAAGTQRSTLEPTDDLTSLLLVAAVRSGRRVAAIDLPDGCVWELPRDADHTASALRRVKTVDVERVRLDAAVKRDDGFFTTFFVSSYSRYWARWAARRGLTPNQVTSASMALGVAAAAAFAVGTRWWAVSGAVLLQLAFTLDCVDGQLARYSRRFSAVGAWLDSIFDRGKEYVVLAGLAIGGLRAGDDGLWLLAGAALALQVFRHTLDLGYAEQQTAEVAAGVAQPLAPVSDNEPSFWEPVPSASPTSAPAAGSAAGGTRDDPTRSLARSAIDSLRRAEGVSVLRWGKRIVVLPIGERFLLISVLAVVATPRVVFLALLVWGGAATLYTFGGRLIRSLA
jgi:phosphatidylglycerophosphate synthase